MKLSRFAIHIPSLKDMDGNLCLIVFSTRSARALLVRSKTWEMVVGGQHCSLAPEDLAEFIDAEILVPEAEDEFATVLRENALAAQDDPSLYLVLQPSARCQLGCEYCGQVHSQNKMSEEVQNSVVALAEKKLKARSSRYQSLRICWFGAEPLMGLSIIENLSPKLQNVAADNAVTYSAKMVTNGLALTPRVAESLVISHAVNHFEITLDGMAEDHDSRRHTKRGNPTFERIYENLRAIISLKLEAKYSIRCNVDKDNIHGAHQLIDMLAGAGLLEHCRFYVAPLHPWGNEAHMLGLTPEKFSHFEISILKHLLDLGFNGNLLPSRRMITCMSLRPDSEVVDAFGGRFKCTEVSYVPAYGTPNVYEIGTLPEEVEAGGGDNEPTRAITDFLDLVAKGSYECSECEIFPVCGGGCPKQWAEGYRPCPATKLNIRDRILLAYRDFAVPCEEITTRGS